MDAHQESQVTLRRRHRSARVLRAFGCGCFDDWSDDPPGLREERAREAVEALVSTILDPNRGSA